MQEIRSSKPPVVTGIGDPNKSQARHHRSLKLGSKLKYLSTLSYNFATFATNGVTGFQIMTYFGRQFTI